MPTTRSDGHSLTRAVVAALLPLALAGCSSEPVHAPSPDDEDRAPGAAVDQPAPDVAKALARTLDRRAEAVRRGDSVAFLAGVAAGNPDFLRAQETYLANLDQLPVADFGYALDRNSLVRADRGYWATVDVTLELDGYDDRPVVTRDRYLFTGREDGRYALAAVTNRAWERQNRVETQPWDLGPIIVRTGVGVLGIFDTGSAAYADGVVAEVEQGRSAVSAEIPFAWDADVVVYALSDPGFMSGLDNVPGGDPLRLDAVTFEVAARPGGKRVADTRFVLNPRILAGGSGAGRGRLIRHELTHLAVGERANGVPTWLSEGLAEYVSVRSIPPEDRAFSGASLAAAEAGLSSMPADEEFAGSTSEASYGIAWWACEYLADAYSESILWTLLDTMRGADPDQALNDLLVIDEAELARRAGRLMLATYQPTD